MAIKIKVSSIGILDMLKFKNQPKVRRRMIEKSHTTPLPKEYGSNARARELHPKQQKLTIEEVIQHNKDVKSFVLATKDGKAAGYFRAGQYLSICLDINGSKVTRPYSISSSPSLALKGKYILTIKRTEKGFVSDYILSNWKKGTNVITSGAEGEFYYEGLRDAKKVIGVAGGSGITPFLSMAYAIKEGIEDFELIVLYGSRTAGDILFQKEFTEISRNCSKVKLVNVLSEETKPGCESGFITAELIKKYMNNDKGSIFICGPQAMYKFLEAELSKINLPKKYVRRELFGIEKNPWTLKGYPAESKDKIYKLTVINCGKSYTVDCCANENILVSIERAGILAPSRCRSGECGFCHSRLVSGNVFVPEDTDGRRAGDLVYGYIHPCASFPLSDLKIEIPGAY